VPARDPLPAAPRRLDTIFTPGQRWSAALVVGLAVVLAAAQPHVRGGFGDLLGPAPRAAASAEPTGGDEPSPVAAPDLDATVVPSGANGGAAGGSVEEFPVPPDPPKVVALVRSADGAPGRDDAAIAAVFLETASFEPTVMSIPESVDAAFCRQVAAAGSVAVTGAAVDQTLRDCLTAAGVLLVGFDTLGSAESVVSTRLGVGEVLDELALWSKRSRALAGKVGVVGTTPAKPAVEAAVGRMKAAGVDVAATAFVPDGSSLGGETSEGVRSFATAGVETVVFAAPVAQQRAWVTQQAVLSPGVKYVVADAYDAVLDEAYPATFEGSVALTSLRVPWFARDNEPTPEQRQCQTTWEQKATPPATLGSAEQVRVFAWCQHVALLTAGLDAFSSGTFASVLRSVRFTSPLTSDVGPFGDTRWGPTQDAVLVWQASCACWKQRSAFADRS
jgi:hypothetical protein